MHWYDKKWVIWLAIVLFFPVGLIMMWRSPNFGTKTKIIVSALFAFLIYSSATRQHDSTVQNTATPSVKTEQPAPQKQYAPVDVNTMMAELQQNAAAAQKKYKGQLVCVTGRIGVIDSNGDYLAIFPDDQYAITGVRCDLAWNNKEQENFLLSVQMNQRIRAYGKISDVGEVIGYALSVDKFEK